MADEGSRAATHVQQPDPFSSPGEKLIEITDPQGRKTVIREKGQKPKAFTKVKGRVMMIRGDLVMIRVDERDHPIKHGDRVELSYSVDGEVISVGTWRVSLVKEDGTVEALAFNIKGNPNIGMDALFFAEEERPQPIEEPKLSEKEKLSTLHPHPEQKSKEETSIEKETEPKTMEARLASYSKTVVPMDFSGTRESVPCESGTIRLRSNRIEMTASGGKEAPGYCTFKTSDTKVKDFFASAKVTVNTDSQNNFIIGFIYGDEQERSIKSDSLIVTLSQMSSKVSTGLFKSKTTLLIWVGAFRRSEQGKGQGQIVQKFLYDVQTNPTPGTLSFLKTGQKCRIFWNGEEMGSWDETILSDGYLWLGFTPVGKGKASATFEDIRVYHLQ